MANITVSFDLRAESPEPGAEVIEADFPEPKTIQILAAEQRQFMKHMADIGPLINVKLPPDD